MAEPFQRVEGSRSSSIGGTGLGLAIARYRGKPWRQPRLVANEPTGLVARLSLPISPRGALADCPDWQQLDGRRHQPAVAARCHPLSGHYNYRARIGKCRAWERL